MEVFEVFKNTLPARLYCIPFPIEDLRQAIETTKRIFRKEKIDTQLAGQSSSMPFMNIRDGYISEKVTFDTQGGLEEKISMMSKLATQEESQNKQFKPKMYQSKRTGQTRNIYNRCSYDPRNYQNRYRSNSGDRRISFSGRIQHGQNYRDNLRCNHNYKNDFRRANLRGNVRLNQNYRGQNYRGGHRRHYRMIIIKEEAVGLEKDSF